MGENNYRKGFWHNNTNIFCKKGYMKFTCALLLIMLVVCLSGCKGVKLVEEKVDTSEIKTYKRTELVEKNYYIKDGANFRSLYIPSVKDNTISLFCGFDVIPTLYKGECVVYWDSNSSYSTTLPLTRFKSIGYNFGIYGGYLNSKGNYVFSLNDIEENSSTRKIFNMPNGEIEVYDIDDVPVEKEMVYNGILGGINYFGSPSEHKVHFYKGTKDYTYTLKNDVFSMVTMENYTIGNYELTQNGYIQFTLDNDFKSGYYYIENKGLFRYVNMTKEEAQGINIKEIDYYEPLYSVNNVEEVIEDIPITENEQSTYQTFSVQVSEKKSNFEFIVYYEEMSEIPYIALKSPTGDIYSLKKVEGQNANSILMSEVGVGEWKILINNDLIKIIDVVAKEKEEKVVTKEVTKEFEFEQLSASYKVTVSYSGGNVFNAYVTNEITNEADVLVPTNKSTYEYTYNYLTGGKFKVIVICDEKTTVDIQMDDCSNYEKETLIFE